MKPVMLFAIVLMTAIILASSFGLHIMPTDSPFNFTEELASNALYVCPAADQVWDPIAQGLRPFMRYFTMVFFFAGILLLFAWGWALYQNLLKDAFKPDGFKTPWAFTKILFWAIVLVSVLAMTPNFYRSVHVNGADGAYVMCESNTPGARPVRAAAVER